MTTPCEHGITAAPHAEQVKFNLLLSTVKLQRHTNAPNRATQDFRRPQEGDRRPRWWLSAAPSLTPGGSWPPQGGSTITISDTPSATGNRLLASATAMRPQQVQAAAIVTAADCELVQGAQPNLAST
ncbi:hypothetical protein NDU88_004357 [Pleurodeles waltl]|uniref:Uncharacterized protein n=1 Tax=Pleurodeles waltl TaxID=8319 RepID=A0AAV7QE81_PLEWA|nr:hypothetical protein NDU88_004357 [Pleurodeles waltl]